MEPMQLSIKYLRSIARAEAMRLLLEAEREVLEIQERQARADLNLTCPLKTGPG